MHVRKRQGTCFHVADEIERWDSVAKQTVLTHCGKWYQKGALEAYGGGGQPSLQRPGSLVRERTSKLGCPDDSDLGAGQSAAGKGTS